MLVDDELAFCEWQNAVSVGVDEDPELLAPGIELCLLIYQGLRVHSEIRVSSSAADSISKMCAR